MSGPSKCADGKSGALLCGLPTCRAACAGVLIHALAGDRWRARVGGDRGLLAGEMPEEVPRILAALIAGRDPLAAV